MQRSPCIGTGTPGFSWKYSVYRKLQTCTVKNSGGVCPHYITL